MKKINKNLLGSDLNPKYTLESFIPGENSDFAYNACEAIAKEPGFYNPCFIYGPLGLGKTHLLQAVGNAILKHNGKLKVVYVTAVNFFNEFVQAIKNGKEQQFKDKYSSADVLLMDDIQFLENREATQNELLNIFNDLLINGAQLLFTSDRPTSDFMNVSENLLARFNSGLHISIEPPEYKTRVRILNSKCENAGLPIKPEVVDYIAQNVTENVRVLESCITKLVAYHFLINKEIDLKTAQEQLKIMINANRRS